MRHTVKTLDARQMTMRRKVGKGLIYSKLYCHYKQMRPATKRAKAGGPARDRRQ